MLYLDAKTGRTMAKRFNVTSITRDKEYDLTTGVAGNKVLYFSAHANGEAEVVQIQLTPGCKAKKKIFDFDFAEIDIKGRSSKGNIVSRYPVKKVSLMEIGNSSLGAQKIWMDEVSGRLNKEERGRLLGSFDTGDNLIALFNNGTYEIFEIDFNKKIDAANLADIDKLTDDTVISCVYFEGEKSWTMVKRFQIETSSTDQVFKFISESNGSKLYYATLNPDPAVSFSYKKNNNKVEETLNLKDFIDVKGWKALGNKLIEFKILKIEDFDAEKTSVSDQDPPAHEADNEVKKDNKTKLSPGDSIEFDF
jgi:topoisomerase-4 subunit A